MNRLNTHIELLEEPKLLFGHQFEGDDVKEAIETFGTYGTSVEGLHTSEVKIGFIGTREGIAQAARDSSDFRVMLLDQHGIVAVGADLMEAFMWADLYEELSRDSASAWNVRP